MTWKEVKKQVEEQGVWPVKNADVLATAQRTVKPIIDKERESEEVGDLMNLRLCAAAPVDDEKAVDQIVELMKGALRSIPAMTQERESWDAPDNLLLGDVLAQFDAAMNRERVHLLSLLASQQSAAIRLASEKESGKWQPIEDLKEYGTFEVWLETPDRTLNSQVGIANIHPNATIVNGHFSYDMPKILYVRPLPAPPEQPKEMK